MATFMTDAKTLSSSDLTKEIFWEEQLEVSDHTKTRLEGMGIDGTYSVHSAQSQILSQLKGNKWLAVGDAAQSYDPLSSAGIIKGLKMGQLAATKLSEFHNDSPMALDEYEAQIRTQFEEYLVLKDEYYLKEKRWMNEAFWFKRNLKPQLVQQFTIHPNAVLETIDSSNQVKLAFLKDQFPDIDLKGLIESINLHSIAKDAIGHYLNILGLQHMNKNVLYALENLKVIGVIRVV
jgi:flavin-dependent dehydrogenase